MAFAPTWHWQIAGRIVAGVGGVLLNVLMSKMVQGNCHGDGDLCQFLAYWDSVVFVHLACDRRGKRRHHCVAADGRILRACFYSACSIIHHAFSSWISSDSPSSRMATSASNPSDAGSGNDLGLVQCRAGDRFRLRNDSTRGTGVELGGGHGERDSRPVCARRISGKIDDASGRQLFDPPDRRRGLVLSVDRDFRLRRPTFTDGLSSPSFSYMLRSDAL